MPLFKMGVKEAWAASAAQQEQEFARLMTIPPVPEFAVELMAAFGTDGPKRGKPLTERDLTQWWLDRHEFESRRQRVLCMGMLRRGRAPFREALQVLEHAELVYLTVRTDREDIWTATNLGISTLAEGRDAVARRVGQRPGSEPKSVAERLEQLESLRSSGVISDAEYTAKREHIIGEI